MANATKTKVIRLAAEKLGGPRKLRDHLAASSAEVASWLSGIEEPPAPMLLKALDVILNDLDARGAPRGKKTGDTSL